MCFRTKKKERNWMVVLRLFVNLIVASGKCKAWTSLSIFWL